MDLITLLDASPPTDRRAVTFKMLPAPACLRAGARADSALFENWPWTILTSLDPNTASSLDLQ